ncbi:4-hydroxyacetophenone monooxygenase [Acidimicrobiaceae bacterium]|nr:4-hydroxyacetophenone monooxygenase [Acidimicrobiaceae bacterium]
MTSDLEQAFQEASIPTLLMCLVQITGDESWLREPFLPKRDTNLFADESGGLSEESQQQIRAALMTVLGEISAGQRKIAPPPKTELFTKMMSLCVAEEVAPEYAPMMMEAMGFISRDVSWRDSSAVLRETLADFNVLIIGAGFSGICAAIKLDQLGIRWMMADANADIGGTWLVNDYPEAGVDTPNHFYSFTFAPNHRWPKYFSKQIDVLNYCKSVAEKFKVADRISLNTEVVSTTWDEASQTWLVVLRNQRGELRETRANVVISGVGQLNRPKKSFIKGIESFSGPCFHSAQWRHDVDLSGKRVAIIGTGASAMQILRTVASQASQVTIFQRSPQWVRPATTTTVRSNRKRCGCSRTCHFISIGIALVSSGDSEMVCCQLCAEMKLGHISTDR